MIRHYAFGRMQVDGKTYTRDLIVHADGTVRSNWWRASGHRLVPEDITDVLEAPPKRLVIGTGALGMMQVDPSLLQRCADKGIDVVAERTCEAVERFNEAALAGIPVAGCFHLTC